MKDFQSAMSQLNKKLSEFKNGSDKFVTIGIHEDAGMVEDGTITQAQLGAIQHFGDRHIPARPWLDVGVLSGLSEYENALTDLQPENIEKALTVIGVEAVSATQTYIRGLQTPPNATSTIKQKGSNNPLIDTGEMLGSVDFAITNEKPEEGLS